MYCNLTEFVSVQEPYRTLINFWSKKFSKTTRQKFKVNIFSDRVKLALSEYFLTFNICRVVFENFD